jgi:hypothetical protein
VITPTEFYAMLEQHDWFYSYSDDHRVWTAGNEANRKLQSIIQENDVLTRMYVDYSKSVHNPDLGKPVLEDYL